MHKRAELARLVVLSGEATRQLIDGESHVLVDPVSLRPPSPQDDPVETFAFILDLAERVESGAVDFPAWLIDKVLADESFAAAYRQAGLFDAYQVLVRLTETWLRRVGSEIVPDLAAIETPPAETALESFRRAVLASENDHGHSSVWLFTRADDVGEEPAERFFLGEQMIQCVRVACAS
jgi:hypothetical protein